MKKYVLMFLLCLSAGYAISVSYNWQYYIIIGIFILSVVVNFLIDIKSKKKL